MASAANTTPRLKPPVGAELGPVMAASQPILIGSDWAMAGFASGNAVALNAPALPSKTRRREMIIDCSLDMFYRRPSLLRASALDRSGLPPGSIWYDN